MLRTKTPRRSWTASLDDSKGVAITNYKGSLYRDQDEQVGQHRSIASAKGGAPQLKNQGVFLIDSAILHPHQDKICSIRMIADIFACITIKCLLLCRVSSSTSYLGNPDPDPTGFAETALRRCG